MDLSEDDIKTHPIIWQDNDNIRTNENKRLKGNSDIKTRENKRSTGNSNIKTNERYKKKGDSNIKTRENKKSRNENDIKTRENVENETKTLELEDIDEKDIETFPFEVKKSRINYEKKKKELYDDETKLLNSNKIKDKCKSSSYDEIISYYKNKRLNKEFFPYQLMEKLSCYFSTHVELSSQINSQITELRTLSSGVEGETYNATFRGIQDLIVLKKPKERHTDSVIHEFFVALVCTNRLRETIPNFEYIYGTFHCAVPKESKDWCEQKSKKLDIFLILEKINGKTWANSIITCSLLQYLSYLLQICASLQIAEEKNGFTHYDLHSNNIILRDYPGPYFYIKYGDMYIKTDKIATIIDYGRVSINANGKWYGTVSEGLEKKIGHFYDRMNPDFDLFKMIGSSYHYANQRNNLVIKNFTKLILAEYFKFNVDDKIEYGKQLKIGFSWMKEGRPMGQFLAYLFENPKIQPYFKEIASKDLKGDERSKILCLSDLCLTKI